MPFSPQTSVVDDHLCLTFNVGNKDYQMLMPNDVLSPYVFMEVFSKGCYPIISAKAFKPKVIIDIGGYVGDTALYFHIAYPEAKVHVYEPATKNLFYMSKNLKDISQIKIHPYGLSTETKEVNLYLGHAGPQNSIYFNPETTEVIETIKLKAITEELAQFDEPIDVLKIDIEGGEIKIVTEILKYARNDITMVYVEYHSEEDRLALDQLMKGKYNMGFAQSSGQNRGTNLYVLKTFSDEAYYVQPPIISN